MNNEKTNNSEQSGGNEFNVELNEAEKRSRFHSIGRKALDAVRRLFSGEKHEKEPDNEYHLAEHMPTPESRKGRKYLEKLYDHWDNYGAKMPQEIGVSLEPFVNSGDYWFGVHRSSSIDGKDFENDGILQKIMTEGLQNAGDASSGFFRKNPPVSKTVAHCGNMLHTAIHLKSSYKGSTGGVLVAIPKEYVDDEGYVKPGMEDKVYDNNNKYGISVIRPEFLMGFMQSLGEGTTMKFKTRGEILEAASHPQRGTEE